MGLAYLPQSLLLDADVLIDLKRGAIPSALSWLVSLPDYPYVSGVAVGEIVYGARSAAELKEIRAFLMPFPVLWPDAQDMRHCLTYADLKLSHGIGFLDALTATIALRHGLTVATFNVKHFKAIPRLTIVQPYVRSSL